MKRQYNWMVVLLFFMALSLFVGVDRLQADMVVQDKQNHSEVYTVALNRPADEANSSPPITAIEDNSNRADKRPHHFQDRDYVELTSLDPKGVFSNNNSYQDLGPNDTQLVHTPLGILYKKNPTAQRAVEKNIVFFSERLKERFSVWLERSARYLEIMQDILTERGLPEELVFLPIIESGFNMNAYSRASAVGPWQFIASTAKRYGLTIDWWRDERKDPIKSTEAAASYLKDLYRMFGAWHLALAAYNAGEGRIMRALKSTGADDYWDLLKTKKIHSETKEYVPRYIAATKIATRPHKYGFEDLNYHAPFEFEEVTITEPLDLEVIALSAETTVQVIKELNPELRRWCTPLNAKQYTVRIPVGSKELFFENLQTFREDERLSFDTYTVQKGDTIKRVAQKTGYPIQVILAMNSLEGIETLKPGERLKLPPKDKFALDIDDIRGNRSLIKKASYKKTEVKKANFSDKRSSKKTKTKQKTKGKKI